ncbi:hypothetical protein C8J57DRAFT_1533640 [Mycena rebaudengoi]|nr:hypothetical protein C8J57DRAFT_1533640 [Mycena rebaudengoi]
MEPMTSRKYSLRCRPSVLCHNVTSARSFGCRRVSVSGYLPSKNSTCARCLRLPPNLKTPQTLPLFGSTPLQHIESQQPPQERILRVRWQHAVQSNGQTMPYARKGLLAATLLMFVASNLQILEQLAFIILQPLTLRANPQTSGGS